MPRVCIGLNSEGAFYGIMPRFSVKERPLLKTFGERRKLIFRLNMLPANSFPV